MEEHPLKPEPTTVSHKTMLHLLSEFKEMGATVEWHENRVDVEGEPAFYVGEQ